MLVHNFRPAVPKRLGIDFDRLTLINPRLIYCAVTGYGEHGPMKDKAGYDQFQFVQEFTDRDPRLGMTIVPPGFVRLPATRPYVQQLANNFTGYHQLKGYFNFSTDAQVIGSTDVPSIRYAEVLLNYVESLLELDDWQNPDIVTHLNDLRTRAGMPRVDVARFNTKDKLRVLIRRERQAELAFEGQRYFDIRRWGTVKTLMNGEVFGATDPATGQAIKVQDRAYTDRDYYWPIPEKEVLLNYNMKQNDGY